mmetsp:Transcript_10233/g.41674  ORF Transcript_10233/g.41674 Transcript_10233/m.41674 type:complete len:678 (+) Transcript_10233:155-2188(+)|eukprot:CAMPEP_0114626148 /NCGR_PEP_ID=MMETSP0168-20121206/11630_1 /TAXON_ID=95228 ORGANISM="Vannella sp., Strain DIVA3 517/6/12" /NCGR_SAMPLE_ID=MMETSP0168 /ASSEMBLY_ACC=CAM_ASM_000044 /LENGTH=677 /DNA_ID=CAMNT_0001837439 /DNA_START=144 /DNA_END=2177 /DNA_ORIENTATION=+
MTEKDAAALASATGDTVTKKRKKRSNSEKEAAAAAKLAQEAPSPEKKDGKEEKTEKRKKRSNSAKESNDTALSADGGDEATEKSPKAKRVRSKSKSKKDPAAAVRKHSHRRKRSMSTPVPAAMGLTPASPSVIPKSPARLIEAGGDATVPEVAQVGKPVLDNVDMDGAARAIEAEMLKWRETKEESLASLDDAEAELKGATQQMESVLEDWQNNEPKETRRPAGKKKTKSLQRTISVSFQKAKGQLLRSDSSVAKEAEAAPPAVEPEEEEEVLAKINERLAAEGKQMVTVKERRWLLQGGQADSPASSSVTNSPAGSRIGAAGSRIGAESPGTPKSMKAASRKQLMLEVERLQRELNRATVSNGATAQVKDMLAEEVAKLNENIIQLEEELQDARNNIDRMSSRLEILALEGNEREEAVSQMEAKLRTRIEELTETEKTLNRKLKTSIAAQSRMEKQMLQLRGGSINLEQDRSDMQEALDRANKEILEQRQKIKWLKEENERRKAHEAKLTADLEEKDQDLKDTYEYMDLLEGTDVQLRTAVAIVQKQNRAFAQINNNLKKQLGEAQAALAMQQMYLDGEDGDLDVDDLLDQAEIDVRGDVPDAPEMPDFSEGPTPTSSYNILASIPNYVAKRREVLADAEESPAQVDMVDVFTKALIERRAVIDEDVDDEDDDWDD